MKTILVVDDERNIVELVRLYLEKEGFTVVAAGDGEQALVQYERCDPDLVVLDVMLPKLDGFEVCRELRRRGDVPILMLTARSEDIDAIVGLELGADDYVTKPFNPRALVARVKAILRRTEVTAKAGGRSRSATSASTGAGARLRSAIGGWTSGPASSICWPRWHATRASCSAATRCWRMSGAPTSPAKRGPSTSTWRKSARSSAMTAAGRDHPWDRLPAHSSAARTAGAAAAPATE